MYLYKVLTLVLGCGSVAGVRDFYAGWFNKHDLLVAQDTLFKERSYYRTVTAHYARDFKCPISYYRVLDRLGVGRGPKTKIVKGGLRKNFLVLRITSAFNYPVSVNIYIACANRKDKGPMFTTPHWTRDPRETTKPKTTKKQSTPAASVATSATTQQATSVGSSVATVDTTKGATTIAEAATATSAVTEAATDPAAESTTAEGEEETEAPKKYLRVSEINAEPETNSMDEKAPIIVAGRVQVEEGLNSIGE